jgi:hypothetical protein
MKIDMMVFGGVARVPRAAPTTTTATRSDESDIVQSGGYLTVAESNDGSKSGTAGHPCSARQPAPHARAEELRWRR